MAEHSTIEWTDATWNPITGCTLVSEGCKHCYAATLAATRLKNHPSREGLARINAAGEAKFTGAVKFNSQWIDQPLRWKRPRMIFVCAHGDLFHEKVPDHWINQVFAVMALAPQHTFQVLTKRPERAVEYLIGANCDGARRLNIASQAGRMMHDGDNANDYVANLPWPLSNMWLGTSIETQATANARIPHLLAAPAVVRFASAEPLLGSLYLDDLCDGWKFIDALRGNWWHDCDPPHIERGNPRLDWVIVGGESGKKARPMHPDWARSLRDQCVAAGTAFFFKQWGEFIPTERLNDLGIPHEGYVHPDGCGAQWPRPAPPGMGEHGPHTLEGLGFRHMTRVGKKAAGRMLDGRTWDELPRRAA